MGKPQKKKNDNQRFMNFNNAVLNLKANNDYAIDQKFVQITQQFTTTLSAMQHKLTVLEDVLKNKGLLGESELKEAGLVRLEKLQGFIVEDGPADIGNPLKVSLKEEEVGKEKADEPMTDAFMIVGNKDVHEAIDTLVVGAKAGETREVILDDPDNKDIKRKITVVVNKVYKKKATPNAQTQTQA